MTGSLKQRICLAIAFCLWRHDSIEEMAEEILKEIKLGED